MSLSALRIWANEETMTKHVNKTNDARFTAPVHIIFVVAVWRLNQAQFTGSEALDDDRRKTQRIRFVVGLCNGNESRHKTNFGCN